MRFMRSTTNIDVIVSRHIGLVQHLADIGIGGPGTLILEHATADDVRGQNVAGVLPLHMAALCRRYVEVPLNLPPELRGQELSADQVAQYAGAPVEYQITARPVLPAGEIGPDTYRIYRYDPDATRVANILREAGYLTTSDVDDASDSDLLSLPGIGPSSLKRVRGRS